MIADITMGGRMSMKSSNLQKILNKDYETFFLQNNLVVSVPQVVHRGCILNKKNIKPQIKQKIPTKMFVGININHSSADIVFSDVTYFSSVQNQFVTVPFETIFADININYFQQNIKSKLLSFGYDQGIEINFFSENERGSGIEFCGIIPVLMSAIIHILTDKITIDKLNDDSVFQNSPQFESIYRLAMQLFQKSEYDRYGTTARTAMTNHWLPILSWESTRVSEKLRLMENKDFFCIKENLNQPMIDYGILSFGSLYDESYIDNIYDNIKDDNFNKIQNNLNEVGNYLNERLIRAWGNMIKSQHDGEVIDDFIDNVIQQGLFGSLVEKNCKLLTDISFLFTQSQHFKDERIGLMPLTSNKDGGSFLFVTQYKKSRETMEKLLIKLKEYGYNIAHYQYLSWIDGFTNEGLKIEQYLNKGVYSDYVQKNSTILIEFGSDKVLIGNHREILKNLPQSIVFDTIDEKIYLNGKMATHKHLYTQSGTIEVMKKLCLNESKYHINNKHLQSSSYSKNKNEMLGKIILPLQKLIEKKYKIELPIKCTGSVVDFDITLENCPLKMYFIQKIV